MDLPIEVISYMMGFLTAQERQDASLVCKKWYNAFLDPALHTNSVIRLQATSATAGKIHDLGKRKSPSLILSHIDGTNTCTQALQEIGQHLGSHLTSLSFRGSEVNENIFLGVIKHCPELQFLDLSCCNALFMTGNLLENEMCIKDLISSNKLEKLTSLNLATNRFLSDELFNRLMSVMPNISKLSMASCNIVHRSEDYGSEGGLSRCFLSLSNLLMYLQNRSEKINALNLSSTGIGNEALKLISHVKDLVLEELILSKCNNISNRGVEMLVMKQTSLKTLNLSGIASLNSQSLLAICIHLPDLEHLSASEWSQLEPASAVYLSSLKKIKSLNFSNCYQVGLPSLSDGLCGDSPSQLMSLSLGGCGGLHDDAVLKLVKNLPQLEKLDLSSCYGIGDASVHAIARWLPNLKKLRLAWCKKITDFGLLGLDSMAPVFLQNDKKYYSDRFTKSHSNMGFFKLPSFNEKIQDIPEKEILKLLDAPDHVNLTALKELKSLDLTACNHITDICIVHAIRFPKLRSLNLSLCSNITDGGLVAIATNNPSLRELLVGQCHRLTDSGVRAMIVRQNGLLSLDICGCDKVTDASLLELGKHTRHLEHLNVSQCSHVTMATAQSVQLEIPSLRSLQMVHVADAGKEAFYHYQSIHF